MSSFPNVTKEQQAVIDELERRTINDVSSKMLEDEFLFYRFCKARNFNLKEAEILLRKHIDWRKEYQMDTILTDYKSPEVFKTYAPTDFVCFDKEDFVVRYVDFGNVDARGIEFMLFCLKVYQDNYPERLKCCFFINGKNNSCCEASGWHYDQHEPRKLLCNNSKLVIKNKDIGFSLNFRRNAFEEPVALVPKQRIDTCYEPEKGLFKCDEIGMYTLVFDNSYSWMYPKEIYYRARLKSPRADKISDGNSNLF
ncbi:SEC14-like protein 2 [Nephila pilipes]|uniref:SEC14-like protein 2 n=1 Tax=Nephila pilipes TaxID=299642 RepID=A0A8X6JWQ9_NEPPI|nr:SEC14-like protein 2 [Nephila pilipes]